MRKFIYLASILAVLIFLSIKCNAQFYAYKELDKEIDKIKKSKIFVVIDQKAHDNNSQYADIYKEYWKFSEVEIIEPNELGEYLKPGNYFITLKAFYPEGWTYDKPASKINFCYFLWTPDPKYLEKNAKKLKTDQKIDIIKLSIDLASINMDFDRSEPFMMNDIMSGEYFGNGHALYGGLGVFKNYLQSFQNYLAVYDKEREVNRNREPILNCNDKELKNLTKEILYIPNTVLIYTKEKTFNKFIDNKLTPHDVAEIFENYPYKYEVISLKDLNEKILNSKEPIYYFINIKGIEFCIFNSVTGEFIYKQVINDLFDLRRKDLKKFIKTFEKLK